jgi:hypothetical protein
MMKLARMILSGIWGGAYAFAAVFLFKGNLEVGLGVFVIGTWFVVWYILLWMVACRFE